MARLNPQDWMLSEAIEALARAERLHRQFFQLQRAAELKPAWEPPADVIETELEVLILIALPGVDPAEVGAALSEGHLTVTGRRVLPPELRSAVIHRLELPQGRFERRIALPPGRYLRVRRLAANGCLIFSLEKGL